MNLGEALYQMSVRTYKNYDDAIEKYTGKIDDDPDNPHFYSLRAEVYDMQAKDMLKGQFSRPTYFRIREAELADRLKVIELEPDAVAHYNCGLVYYSLNEYPKAFDMFNRALAIGLGDNTDRGRYMRNLTFDVAKIRIGRNER